MLLYASDQQVNCDLSIFVDNNVTLSKVIYDSRKQTCLVRNNHLTAYVSTSFADLGNFVARNLLTNTVRHYNNFYIRVILNRCGKILVYNSDLNISIELLELILDEFSPRQVFLEVISLKEELPTVVNIRSR